MLEISFVLADVFEQLRIRHQLKGHSRTPRLRIQLWVIERELNGHVSEVLTAHPFRNDKLIGMRITAVVEPGALVDANSLYNEGIAFPLADRIPEPCRVAILRKRPAI